MTTTRSQEMLIECTVCTGCDVVALPELDRDALRTNHGLSRHCNYCRQETLWQMASHTRSLDSGYAAIRCETNYPMKERRKTRRCKTKMTACIRCGDLEDIVTVLDASRNGIRFQSSRQYPNMWVQVAVPHTRGTSNIFMPGRIVWRKKITATLQQYGLQYDQ